LLGRPRAPDVPALPVGMTYVEIAAGTYFTLGRYAPAGAPRIGHDLVFALTQATPNGSGTLYYSGVPATPISLGSGCFVELDLATFNAFAPVVADPAGSWATTVPVPADVSLVGFQVALQIAIFGTAGPLGLDISNGLIVTVGY